MAVEENSLSAGSAARLLPGPFPEPVESDYVEFSLRVFRPGIRAWHTAALCVAVLLLGAESAPYLLGYRHSVLPFSVLQMQPFHAGLLAVAVCARAALCGLSWHSRFLSLYPRVVVPLVMLGHLCINAIFADEIFGPHQGFLAAITVLAFGASFLSGLQFRQSMRVNGIVLCLLALSAWRQPLPPTVVISCIANIAFAMLMAGVLAIALERSMRALYLENRRVEERADSDGLTGLKNRRAFDEHLRRVWQLAIRDKRSLGVLLIDVDFFKTFNDSLGHQAGDAALQGIANVVAATARRPLDLSARYGGEELAIILYDVTREMVTETAERVQRRVEELGIKHPKSAVSPVVTVSTGAAYVRPFADRSPQGAILLADRGLYAAKRSGRNQFTLLDRDSEAITTGVFATSNAPIAKAASR
jgi:diguanylate cyclase (GGDEF)-like protein